MDRAELWGMALTVISGIAMTAGIILTTVTSSTNALCNSGVGQGGTFGSATEAQCVTDTAVHTLGVILMILGILGILVGMGRLFGSSRGL